MHNIGSRRTRYLFTFFLMVVSLFLGFCVGFGVKCRNSASLMDQAFIPTEGMQTAPENFKINFSNEQYLRIDVEAEDGARHTESLSTGSGSDCGTEIYYVDVCDVRIEVDGMVYYLEDAIREGFISLEQIYAYSRIDATCGYCETFTKVRAGLTFLVFRYPEYELRFAYDYFFLPDGEQRLVNELYICKNHYDVNSSANRVVQEDWGVTFEVSDVNSSSVALRCTQSGGQQLGELITDIFFIDSVGEQGSIPRLNGFADIDSYQSKIVIPRGVVSEITLDWKDIYGELSSGDYLLCLKVKDVYNTADTNSFMSKFETRQSYTIPFVIS